MQNYGSAPGELAACLLNVGVAECPSLSAVQASAHRHALDEAVLHGTGHALVSGGAIRVGGTWWCRPDPETVLLVDAPDALARGLALLRGEERRHPTFAVDERHLVVLALIGRRTMELLGELGVYDDPRTTPPCRVATLCQRPATWLLQSDVSVICCVAPEHAESIRDAISAVGRRLGLARVGQEALTHFVLLQRRRAREALRVPA